MKKIILMLLAVIAMFSMSSCSDSLEVRDRKFVQSAGVSLDGKKVNVTVRVFDGFDETVAYTGSGKNFEDAIDDSEKYQGKDFYTGHMELLVTDKSCTNELLSQIIKANVSPSCLILDNSDPLDYVAENETIKIVEILHTAVRNHLREEKTICDKINGR
ncbi:MAG: hypothetical protein Q4F95_15395 [Oscillospiraceae bacterium]|nr:hypothetical protein [Oscillospiraceae bacterium]